MIKAKGSLTGNVNVSVKYKDPITQEKSTIPTKEIQEIVFDEGYTGLSKVTVEAVTSDIDENIKPDNIISGVTILGVIGTQKPQEEVENEINAELENIINGGV